MRLRVCYVVALLAFLHAFLEWSILVMCTQTEVNQISLTVSVAKTELPEFGRGKDQGEGELASAKIFWAILLSFLDFIPKKGSLGPHWSHQGPYNEKS